MSVGQYKPQLLNLARIAAAAGFAMSALGLRHDLAHAPTMVRQAIGSFDPGQQDDEAISSRVLHLPHPHEFSRLNFKIETKQFRFEMTPATVAPRQTDHRNIASVDSGWALAGISRHGPLGSEKINLVRGEDNRVSGSVFVELDEGTNQFTLIYRDPRGHERAREVNIERTAP